MLGFAAYFHCLPAYCERAQPQKCTPFKPQTRGLNRPLSVRFNLLPGRWGEFVLLPIGLGSFAA